MTDATSVMNPVKKLLELDRQAGEKLTARLEEAEASEGGKKTKRGLQIAVSLVLILGGFFFILVGVGMIATLIGIPLGIGFLLAGGALIAAGAKFWNFKPGTEKDISSGGA